MRLLLQCLLAGLFLAGSAAEPPQEFAIIVPGQSHGDEIRVEHGELWWGFFQEGEEFKLKQVTVKVNRVVDPIIDSPGEATGKEVSVAGEHQPLFLFRGPRGFTEGSVKTAHNGYVFIYPGESRSFSTEKRKWSSLHAIGCVTSGAPQSQEPTTKDYAIELWRSRQVQRLHESPHLDNDGPPMLIWAGDLDRDGQVDFIFDLTYHYNVRLYTLFLSSEAKGSELVAKVAELQLTGC